jgi:hypothetical protein
LRWIRSRRHLWSISQEGIRSFLRSFWRPLMQNSTTLFFPKHKQRQRADARPASRSLCKICKAALRFSLLPALIYYFNLAPYLYNTHTIHHFIRNSPRFYDFFAKLVDSTTYPTATSSLFGSTARGSPCKYHFLRSYLRRGSLKMPLPTVPTDDR